MLRTARALTLVEVIVSTFILTLVLMGFMAASSATAAQRTLASENLLAEQALSDLLEDLRARTIPELLSQTGWALPTGTDLLDAQFSVTLIHDEVGLGGTAAAALELTSASGALAPTSLAGPQQLTKLRLTDGLDLNADGDVDDGALPVSTPEEQELIRLVPARLRVEWRSVTGTTRSLEIHAYLTDF